MVISLYQPHSFWQVGRRPNQEDSRYPDADNPTVLQFFYVVCDGVGGSDGGELASQSVCQSLAQALEDTDWSKPFSVEDFREALSEAYDKLDQTAQEADNYDMATTLTFVCFHGGGCLAAHIGDSRIYQIRPGVGIIYRSNDHSQVNSLVHAGVLSPDDAESSSDHSVISRYMEPANEVQPRCMATILQTTDIQADDYFVLCTDGVLERTDDDTLESIVSSKQSDLEKCRLLAKRSKQSNDNNTAYLIHVARVEHDDTDVQTPELADTQPDYAEHTTVRTRSPYSTTEDIEPERPKKSLTTSVIQFFKDIFN
jgi:protein phosphatase